jgi:hypothetical protein
MAAVQDSPGRPRPSDPLVREVADALARIERNYDREGSGPGSRFEGRLLEDVQAQYVVRLVPRCAAARKYLALLDEATRKMAESGSYVFASSIRAQAGLEEL